MTATELRSDLAALYYLDSRILVNRLRRLARNPRRFLPWLIFIVYAFVVRLPQLLARRRTGVPFRVLLPAAAIAAVVPGVFLVVAGLMIRQAAVRAPISFRSPADGRFLCGSALPPRLVVTWLFARRLLGLLVASAANAVLLVVFFPSLGLSGEQLLLLLLGFFLTMLVLTTLPALAYLVGRRRPALPVGPAGTLIALVGAASAALAPLRAAGGPSLLPAAWESAFAGLPPGVWVVEAAQGRAAAAGLLALGALTCLAGAVWLAGDSYPELWAASTRRFALRRLVRGGGLPGLFGVRRALGEGRRRPRSFQSSGRGWVPGGAWVLVWKEWLAIVRGPGGAGLVAGVLLAAVLAGGLFGVLALRGPRGSAGTVLSVGTVLVAGYNLIGAMRLAGDLRNPLWWLSSSPLRTRLLALTLASVAFQLVPMALATGLGLVLAGLPLLLLPAIVAAMAAGLWLVRAVALATYTVFPAAADLRGPARGLRMLLVYAALLPVLLAFGLLYFATHSPLPGAAAAVLAAAGESWLLVVFAAGRLRENGLAFAREERA